MELSYRGTNYHGWQKQTNAPTVQETLESALFTFLRVEVSTTGAGRTDSGVHANYFVLHFDMEQKLKDIPKTIYRLNSILPNDIAIHSITPVSEDAHARFDAVERVYKYHLTTEKDPFSTDRAWFFNTELDETKMNKAAKYLLEAEDFTSFSKLHSDNRTNLCDVHEAEWVREGGRYLFTISANRFLRNMVRAIVGTLVDVGRGKISVEEFKTVLESRDRSLTSSSAPGEGLSLNDIVYPESVFKRKKQQNKL